MVKSILEGKILRKVVSICLIFWCLTVYPQVNQKWVINDFSKGLNTKLSNHALPFVPFTQADICENVRFDEELKSLTKRDDILKYGTADTSEAITGMHRLYLSDGTKVLIVTHGDEVEKGTDSTGAFTNILDLGTANYRFQWLTWHDLAIGTDGYNQPVKTDGTDATYLGTCFAEDAGSGAGPDGTYHYKVSYYTASYEVIFDVASNAVTVTDNDISLSMIPIAPDTYGGEDVVGRKIYRHKNGASTYYLLSNGTIANNTATTLTDSDSDAQLTATTYPAGDATYTPPKGKLCLVHKNRLWIANNPTYPSRIYYAEDGSHDVFVSTAYFNIRPNDGDQIMFIKNLLGILTVGKENSIQKIYTDGDTPSSDWIISDPFSFVGCHAMYTADNSPIGVIYLSRDGIYSFNGQISQLLSEAVTPEIKDILPSNFATTWGKYHLNKYYLTYTSEKVGTTTNNRILVLDLISNAYAIDTISVNCFCAFNSGSDWGVLYSGDSNDGDVFAHTSAIQEVIHRRHSDFSGTFTDARYIPTAWGGDAESPVIEISWDDTIDDLSGSIDSQSGDVNRDTTHGTYVSPVLYLQSSAFDKLYWNETIPGAGGDVTFQVRSGASSAACQTASWGTAVTDPTGSDISGETANTYVQYRVSLDTTDIDYTPTVYKVGNFVVKLGYFQEGSAVESSVPLRWRSGWTDLGYPTQTKELTKFYIYHEGEDGTLTVTFENFEGDTDSFEIALNEYTSHYFEYFTGGEFIGEKFRVDITNDDLNDLKIKEVGVLYDVAPIQ